MTEKKHPSVWNNIFLIPGVKYIIAIPWFIGIGICIIGAELVAIAQTGRFVDHKGNPWP